MTSREKLGLVVVVLLIAVLLVGVALSSTRRSARNTWSDNPMVKQRVGILQQRK
jgi:hypothetical protein